MKRALITLLPWVVFLSVGVAILALGRTIDPGKTQPRTAPVPQVAGIKSAIQVVEATPTPSPMPEPTPTPTPTPTPETVATPTALSNTSEGYLSQLVIENIIVKWANHYGIDPGWLLRVAECESHFDPSAINLKYSDGGNPTGLFQFVPPTFYANALRSGIASPNIWNAEHQAQTAAYMFSIGQHTQWECK